MERRYPEDQIILGADPGVKAMMVNKVAQLAGVPAHVVRYYSRIGLLQPSRNPTNGYKTFALADVARLRFIRLARRLGYSLTDIAEVLARVSEGEPARESMRTLLRRRLAENVEQIALLTQQSMCMERALRCWEQMSEDSADLWELCRSLQTLLGEGEGREAIPEPRLGSSVSRLHDS